MKDSYSYLGALCAENCRDDFSFMPRREIDAPLYADLNLKLGLGNFVHPVGFSSWHIYRRAFC